uniref:(northern house mosquito) hypothetical protein n=1 Tax=Culex pipiens TaxID=7175 RepID=A0A8D8KBL3_CULPI
MAQHHVGQIQVQQPKVHPIRIFHCRKLLRIGNHLHRQRQLVIASVLQPRRLHQLAPVGDLHKLRAVPHPGVHALLRLGGKIVHERVQIDPSVPFQVLCGDDLIRLLGPELLQGPIQMAPEGPIVQAGWRPDVTGGRVDPVVTAVLRVLVGHGELELNENV